MARQLEKGNIDLNPSFQRRDAWSEQEKSRLIGACETFSVK